MRDLRTDDRGAVLAEFVVAFPVLLLTFFCFIEMAQVYTAGLVMRHAAVVVARYASVSYPNGYIPDAEDRQSDSSTDNPSWAEAARDGLGPWKDVVRIKSARVALEAQGDPWTTVSTKIDFEYACHVPMAKFIVCRNGLLSRTIRVDSALNGAEYALGRENRR